MHCEGETEERMEGRREACGILGLSEKINRIQI